jgi:hypothetical protein
MVVIYLMRWDLYAIATDPGTIAKVQGLGFSSPKIRGITAAGSDEQGGGRTVSRVRGHLWGMGRRPPVSRAASKVGVRGGHLCELFIYLFLRFILSHVMRFVISVRKNKLVIVKSNSCVAPNSFVIVGVCDCGLWINRIYTHPFEMNISICETICEVLIVSCS